MLGVLCAFVVIEVGYVNRYVSNAQLLSSMPISKKLSKIYAESWLVFWHHLRGQHCQSCQFYDAFLSSGDGQVSKQHQFCRNPRSTHDNRPIPAQAWCRQYQRKTTGK